ncbi:MAG TPA: TetR/AcrR family transcriptional regulator [Anaerolineales bacterium]
MPYPAQIDAERILDKAGEMVEAEGADRFSLHKLAAALGVKAPSLYRYFASKTALLRALNLRTAQQMVAAMEQAASQEGDARAKMLAMAQACREFGLANPVTYTLAFTNANSELRPDEALLEALAVPLQEVMAEISGRARSLAALRGIWALIHGFILFELSGQLRRGGDLQVDFVQSVEAYLNGWGQ